MKKIIENGRKRKGALDSTSEKSDERIKKIFDNYANSKLFDHDFYEMKSTERIKFVQEMAPYFLQKVKYDNIERYDIDESTYERMKSVYPNFDKESPHLRVYRGDPKEVSEWYNWI